jgi:hypothetical protein
MDKYYLYEVINTRSILRENYLGITRNIDKCKITLLRKLYRYCETGEGYNPVFHILVSGHYSIRVLTPLSESYIKSIKTLNSWIELYDLTLHSSINNYEEHIPYEVRKKFIESFDKKTISYYTHNKKLYQRYYEQNREKILEKYKNIKIKKNII